jgi:tRNA 5-methylaminomethyl-2-thiouridine biosynthesis bifunctional protein
MWTEQLFEQIGRLSKQQANIATFTVAGFVKRQLQKVGFRTEKKSYIGNKHEMLTGVFQQAPNSHKGYQLRPTITKPQHVSIIGGGIASACAAFALTKQGVKVTLYCKDNSLAQGASSNAIGALYPLLHQQADDISLFYQQAFWRAKEVYNEVIEQGFTFPHSWCGLLEVAYKDALLQRQQKFSDLAPWSKDLIHSIDARNASDVANINLSHGGLFMPNAGWLSPQDAVKQIINAAKATGRLRVENNTLVSKIKKKKTALLNDSHQKNWQLITNKGEFDASVVVFCGGAEIIDFDWVKQLPFSSVQGQVTSMKTNDNISKLSTVICHKGYLTPSHKKVHCIGATFNKNSTRTTPKAEEDQFNIDMLSSCLPELTANINWTAADIAMSKSRLRCMTPDHMPMVGPMPDIQKHAQMYPHLAKDKNWKYKQSAPVIDNLYIMMGFGARGLCSAPLAADILTADLCGTPYPVDNDMLFNLSPNRFVIRDIVRRKI